MLQGDSDPPVSSQEPGENAASFWDTRCSTSDPTPVHVKHLPSNDSRSLVLLIESKQAPQLDACDADLDLRIRNTL